jgi:transposase
VAASECSRCRDLQIEVATLRATYDEVIARLSAELRDLRARVKLDSRNSSKPPSSDPPGGGTKPPPKEKKKPGRRRGGQPGHEGKTRQRFAPEAIDHRVEHQPTACHVCGGRVVADRSLAPVLHQVVDLPPASAEVTEHVLHRGGCSCCGVLVTAPLPGGVPHGAVGPRLQAVLALLVGRFRLSRREAKEAAVTLFGPKAEVSLGTISALEARTSRALRPAYEEAERAVRTAAVVCADETSSPRGGVLDWLWTACTTSVSYFRIDARRSKEAFRRLLPEFSGVLSTDRWASYHEHPPNRRQLCWAHLARNFQELVDRGKPAAPVGHAGLRACREVFAAYRDHKEGRLALASLAKRLVSTRRALLASLRRFRESPDRKARALCRNLVDHFLSLWTFTRWPGVEPTNNLAERELRPAVLWRKNSFGCQSVRGQRFVSRILTVVRTLRRHGRDILAYLEASIRAQLARTTAPALLTG